MGKLSEMSMFQIGVLGFFILAGVVSVILFSFGGPGGSGAGRDVTLRVWGFMDRSEFEEWVDEAGLQDHTGIELRYTSWERESMRGELDQAILDGQAPHFLFLPDREIEKYRPRLEAVPFHEDVITRSEFRDTFVEHGTVFSDNEGLIGLPIKIDPLVVYWNRRIFQEAGITAPPESWGELESMVPNLVRTDGRAVERAAIPLGEYDNVRHSRHIIGAMVLQHGGEMVYQSDGEWRSGLGESFGYSPSPFQAALARFTSFSHPDRRVYTWNSRLSDSLRFFAEGDSAMYIGSASDKERIFRLNPEMNLGVRSLFQPEGEGARDLNTGEMQALAITETGWQSFEDVWTAISYLTSPPSLEALEEISGLPPVRSDMLSAPPADDEIMTVFYREAIRSVGWSDPRPEETERILQEAVSSITGGRRNVREAAEWADRQLRGVLD